MQRLLLVALVAVACDRSEAPAAPDCRPVMGAIGNAQISGHVLVAGKPVASAHVAFVDDHGYAYGRITDATGYFYVEDIWTGSYTYDLTLAGRRQPSKSDRITLHCGENTVTIALASTQAARSGSPR